MPALDFMQMMPDKDSHQSMIGRQLASFRILSLLGKGGMGEVYRARDSKLSRDVALKILPAAFARNPERLARFRREARLLAAVNHPNIAAVYGMEESEGQHCLVMELVEGETLAERLSTAGPVPVAEALRIAVQIAEALEAAHEKNIIHRDLKPANVKVTAEGKVKVLDFGLAKAFAPEGPGLDLSASATAPPTVPTISGAGTEEGKILGTPAYMSPEQVRGKPVDTRTDIWAFGCVLYELLTGEHAFQRETLGDTIAAVLEREPDWQALPASTPASLRRLLRRCLDKDAKQRLQHIGDVRIDIQEALTAPATVEEMVSSRPPRKAWRWALVSGVTCAVVAALVAGFAIWNLRTPAPLPTTRSAITLPGNVALANLNFPGVATSPDGRLLAYVATRSGTQQIFLRALDSLESRPIEGTEGGTIPFFSPDGKWLGFFVGNTLKRISIAGGAAITVCDTAGGIPRGASWGDNNTIAFAGSVVALSQVSAAGGTPHPLTNLDRAKGESSHRWPQFLPGSKAVLFTVQTAASSNNFDQAPIAVQQLETGERKVLVQGGTYGRYLSSGHLAYLRSGTLMVTPFDLKRLEVTGPAVPVVEGIMQSTAGAAQFSISDQGSLAYISGSGHGVERTLVWVDRKGVEQPLGAPSRPYVNPRLSPDGRLLAVDTGGDVWVYNIERRTPSRLTFDGGSGFSIWSPDGKRIAFRSARDGKPANMFWKLADGSGSEERLNTSEHQQTPFSWSPDGQVIAFSDTDPTTSQDLWVLPLSGDRKPRLFLRTPFYESGPKFSPDGRWLAYNSNESGRSEIYVQPFPGPGGKRQISTDGGTEPVWGRNGELFYVSGNRLMAVETKTQPTFSRGVPRLLFEGPYERFGPGTSNYAVSPDGQRFVMIKEGGNEPPPTQINVVLNWFSELRQRVPVK